jgi:hypothetical protein
MVVGAWELISDNSHMTYIFLSVGLARKEEAGLIEGYNQEHQNNKYFLSGQSQ